MTGLTYHQEIIDKEKQEFVKRGLREKRERIAKEVKKGTKEGIRNSIVSSGKVLSEVTSGEVSYKSGNPLKKLVNKNRMHISLSRI